MTSAITPTATPSVEMSEMTEMNACLRLREQVAQRDVQLEGDIHRHCRRVSRISGNRMTSRIDGLLVSSITRRSMPTPSPAGRRQAVLERADVVLVHRVRFEVAARRGLSSCASKRRRCSAGSFSSLKALATSKPPMYSSNRSTVSGSSGFCFESGETSVGKS